jgi:N-methylhydantoinase B
MTEPVVDAVELEIFRLLLVAAAEQMGQALARTGHSANIKERRDFSCAIFTPGGDLLAQAAHVPVHLGSMPASVTAALARLDPQPGDVILLNDPFAGGTHLPDITMITPVALDGRVVALAANRAHHADVGGMSSGSMPLSTNIFQEGLRIPPVRWWAGGREDAAVTELLLANVRTPEERLGDLRAQQAANAVGARAVLEVIERYGIGGHNGGRASRGPAALGEAASRGPAALGWVTQRKPAVPPFDVLCESLLAYAERMMRQAIGSIPDGTYLFEDVLDGDGVTEQPVPIAAAVTIAGDEATVDFTGSAAQTAGCVNCPAAVTHSAVYYVFAALAGDSARGGPLNAGACRPIRVVLPDDCVLNACFPAAVAAGNVETSQRVVDVLLGALARAVPERVCAAGAGTMSSLSLGGVDPRTGQRFTYYETIGGGMGAWPGGHGASAVHTHMTNTMNTPVEALEMAFPLRITRYQVAGGTGGVGRYPGGDGIIREIETLTELDGALLADRHHHAPWGIAAGGPGTPGSAAIIDPDGTEHPLPPKSTLHLAPGQRLRIITPGGGGAGASQS